MDFLCSPVLMVDESKITGEVEYPKTGEEYLYNVIFERKKCQKTVTAKINSENFKKQNVFATLLPQTLSAPCEFLPTKEWQMIQEADFSEVRCNISRLYNSKDVWKHSTTVPPIDDDLSSSLWENFIHENIPQLSLIFTMRQVELEFALDNLIDSLDNVPPGETMDKHSGQWLYAILASLKLPLTPNVCSSLRDLARKCSLIRSKISSNIEDTLEYVMPLNLFICLVARYFRQGDLTD